VFLFQATTSVLTTNLFKRVHNDTITFTSPVKPCLVKYFKWLLKVIEGQWLVRLLTAHQRSGSQASITYIWRNPKLVLDNRKVHLEFPSAFPARYEVCYYVDHVIDFKHMLTASPIVSLLAKTFEGSATSLILVCPNQLI